MITHGNKQISEIVYARKASEGGGAVRLTNIIRGAQVVFGRIAPSFGRLNDTTTVAILAAFGQTDGKAVIKATNTYLNAIAATDPTKATALEGFINEDPMLVCSLGIEGLPIRYCVTDGVAYIDTGIVGTQNTRLRIKSILLETPPLCIAVFGADISYISRNFTAWLHYYSQYDSVGYGGQQKYGSDILPITPLNTPFELDANKTHWTNTKLDGTPIWDITFNTPSAFTTPSTMALFTYKRNGVPTSDTKRHGHAECEIEDGNTHKFFIPFIRNNVNGMLDLIGGTFYANAAASGTFTDAFYLPDGTPWTPLNQTH